LRKVSKGSTPHKLLDVESYLQSNNL